MDGLNPFQVVQATWNLLEVSAAPALAEAKAQGMGIIVKEALANGRLTDRHAGDESVPVRRHAAAMGISVDVVAIAAAVSQPWADVVLSGAVTGDQLISNLAALDHRSAVDDLPSIALPPRRVLGGERLTQMGMTHGAVSPWL